MPEARSAEPEAPEEPAGGAAPSLEEVPAEADAEAASEAPAEDLAARVAQLEQELAEAQAYAQRLQADFANFRRRMFQEQRDWEARGIARFVRDLLPVLDNLERALEAARAASSPEAGALRQGVELTLRQFYEVLKNHGIEPVPAQGCPFDPHLHEALEEVETDAVPEGHVVQELQRGFRQGERLIRPALVRVARAPRAEPGARQAGG